MPLPQPTSPPTRTKVRKPDFAKIRKARERIVREGLRATTVWDAYQTFLYQRAERAVKKPVDVR